MTCECIKNIDEQLTDHTLEVAICFARDRNELVSRTFTPLVRKDNRKHETCSKQPRHFAHTFCPFCGTRHDPEPVAQAAEGGAA